MKTIYLIRHTTPLVAKNICYGTTDLPLADSFDMEKGVIEEKLNGFCPQRVFSSPLNRCVVLAQTLFATVPLCLDDRLKELDFGLWEMKRWEDIDSEIFRKWADGFWNMPPLGGESFETLYNRVLDVWKRDIVTSSGDQIAVVCHSGVIRTLLMSMLEIPHTKIFNIEMPYGTVVKINWHDDNTHQLQFV